jgi:hypothetical protein
MKPKTQLKQGSGDIPDRPGQCQPNTSTSAGRDLLAMAQQFFSEQNEIEADSHL